MTENDEMGAAGRLGAVADGVPPRPEVQLSIWRYLFRYRGVEVADNLCCGIVQRADFTGHNTARCALAVSR